MSAVASTIMTPLARLDERYGELRVVQPHREAVIEKSLRQLGQLMPLVAVERQDDLAVVDGFKRLHAAQQLSFEALEVRVLELSEQAAVAVVYGLNRDGRGMSDFEQALVVRALCRTHGLAQVEAAMLLGHHKSWISRRLSLVEQLDEQVQQDLRVGLVSTSVARELLRLPRGNQAEVAQSVWRHGLTVRDATLLVTLFEKTNDRRAQQTLLDQPAAALSQQRGHPAVPPYDPRLSVETNRLRRRMVSVLESNTRLGLELSSANPASWNEPERSVLAPLMARCRRACSEQGELLSGMLESPEESDGGG